jgi:hypothetical protein
LKLSKLKYGTWVAHAGASEELVEDVTVVVVVTDLVVVTVTTRTVDTDVVV